MLTDYSIGQKLVKYKVFDDIMVLDYARLTGDFNPIHFDKQFASKTLFLKPIVHGPIVLIYITTLFANELPGPGSVYLGHEIKYSSPVYHNDEIQVILEIIEINVKNHIFIKTTCLNNTGTVVLDGVARLKKI